MNRPPFKRRWHPGLGDTRTLEKSRRDLTQQRAELVRQRIAAHGADGLNDWLNSVGVTGWDNMDSGEALAIIRRTLGDDAWRQALQVMVMM